MQFSWVSSDVTTVDLLTVVTYLVLLDLFTSQTAVATESSVYRAGRCGHSDDQSSRLALKSAVMRDDTGGMIACKA